MIYELIDCEDGYMHWGIANSNFSGEIQGKVIASAIRLYKPKKAIRRG